MARRGVGTASALDATFSGDERFVVFCGKESFLHGELTRGLRQALEARSGNEVETVRYEGQRAPLADVLDELRSFGLMQQHKLVVVTEADAFVKSHREALERYAQNTVDTATLLLRADTWYKGKLDKLIEAAPGKIVKCDQYARPQVERWLTGRAAEVHKVKLARDAMSLLLEHIGCDLGRLDAEIGKLAVGMEPGGTIAVEQVRILAGFASDEKAWEIQDALLSGDPRKALEKLHELVDLARHDPVPVGWFVSDLMRKLHHAAAMAAEGARENDICSTLKIWPRERQQPFVNSARRLGTSRAARLLAMAIELDRRAKSGFGNGLTGLERFCVRFTAAIR